MQEWKKGTGFAKGPGVRRESGMEQRVPHGEELATRIGLCADVRTAHGEASAGSAIEQPRKTSGALLQTTSEPAPQASKNKRQNE
jgi:hypothetical protein